MGLFEGFLGRRFCWYDKPRIERFQRVELTKKLEPHVEMSNLGNHAPKPGIWRRVARGNRVNAVVGVGPDL